MLLEVTLRNFSLEAMQVHKPVQYLNKDLTSHGHRPPSRGARHQTGRSLNNYSFRLRSSKTNVTYRTTCWPRRGSRLQWSSCPPPSGRTTWSTFLPTMPTMAMTRSSCTTSGGHRHLQMSTATFGTRYT